MVSLRLNITLMRSQATYTNPVRGPEIVVSGSAGSPKPGMAGDCQLKSMKVAMVASVPAMTWSENPMTKMRCLNMASFRAALLSSAIFLFFVWTGARRLGRFPITTFGFDDALSLLTERLRNLGLVDSSFRSWRRRLERCFFSCSSSSNQAPRHVCESGDYKEPMQAVTFIPISHEASR
jgi:hypothetical protein